MSDQANARQTLARAKKYLSSQHGKASRRRFLKLMGLGAAGVGAAGCSMLTGPGKVGGSGSNPVQRPEISFAQTKTLDVSSGQNIDAALQRAVANDTLVKIPEGTYEVSERIEMPGKAGIEGQGDVTLEVPSNTENFYHISADNRILHVNNLHYDLSGENNCVGIKAYVSGKGYVGNVRITGRAEAHNVVPGLALAARSKNAVLMVENHKDAGRGTGSHTGERGGNGRIAIWSGSGVHEGLAYLKNCSVIDAANNAIYASNLGKNGRFHVDGGIYRHSYGAGVRTGGNGTILENVYIEVDMRKSRRDWWGAQPGIRWEVKGKQKTSEGTIRNCDLRMINGKMAQGIRLQRSAAKVTVKDCRVQIEEPETTPLALYGMNEGPSWMKSPPDEDHRIYVDGLQVSGSAANETASITVGNGRAGSVIKNSFVPGGISSQSDITEQNNVKQKGTPPKRI